MKTTIATLILVLAFLPGCVVGSRTASAPPAEEDTFSMLDAYGVWVDVPGLGPTWQPTVPYGWRPFEVGQWIWTDQGWMWASDEPFGWVVYHYGYWTEWGTRGWLWVPGYDWSPARVRWYAADDFIGWAPLPPPRSKFPEYRAPGNTDVWVVVHAEQFTHTNIGRVRTSTTLPRPGVRRSPEINRAPDVDFIRRVTREDIQRRGTDREDVHRGKRTLSRVRVHEEPPQVQRPSPAPVSPPPAAQPLPEGKQGAPRPSGTTRTPGKEQTPHPPSPTRQPSPVTPPSNPQPLPQGEPGGGRTPRKDRTPNPPSPTRQPSPVTPPSNSQPLPQGERGGGRTPGKDRTPNPPSPTRQPSPVAPPPSAQPLPTGKQPAPTPPAGGVTPAPARPATRDTADAGEKRNQPPTKAPKTPGERR